MTTTTLTAPGGTAAAPPEAPASVRAGTEALTALLQATVGALMRHDPDPGRFVRRAAQILADQPSDQPPTLDARLVAVVRQTDREIRDAGASAAALLRRLGMPLPTRMDDLDEVAYLGSLVPRGGLR